MRRRKLRSKQEDFSFLFTDFIKIFNSIDEENFPWALDSEENYLQRGEYLISLAKRKYEKEVRKLELPKAEEIIFQDRYAEGCTVRDITSRIAKTYVRPLLRNMTAGNDEYATELLENVQLPTLSVEIGFGVENVYSTSTKQIVMRKKGADLNDTCLRILITEQGFPPLCVYGMKNTTHGANGWNSMFRDGSGTCLADLGELFAYLMVYKQIVTAAERNKGNDATFSRALLEFKKEYVDYALQTSPKTSLKELPWGEIFSRPVHEITRSITGLKWMLYTLLSVEVVEHHCVRDRGDCMARLSKEGGPFQLVCYDEQLLFLLLMQEIHMPYHALLERASGYYYPMPYSRTSKSKRFYQTALDKGVSLLWRTIAEEKFEKQRLVRYYRSLDSDYAKSFMLKKNILKSTLSEMSNSLLNNYFGFVEFDNDTDLAKVKEIALEFKAVKEAYLNEVDSSENAIRFRKLGQHKALGLYYPGVKCLCVDIHSPESLIHEYGHLIDFTYGNLSSKQEFQSLKTSYLLRLNKHKDEDESFNKAMKGKTKYNFDYFSMPTEIFARCFELYISQILGVRNSIVPRTFSNKGIYPTDEKFLKEVKEYFSSLSLSTVVDGENVLEKASLKERRF